MRYPAHLRSAVVQCLLLALGGVLLIVAAACLVASTGEARLAAPVFAIGIFFYLAALVLAADIERRRRF